MKIKTTINIRKDLLTQLEKLAYELNTTRSNVIMSLLYKYRRKLKKTKMFSAIQYQPEIENGYKIKAVSFDSEIYEMCLDLKKLFKLSISFIIALAIQEYFKKKIKYSGDNYIIKYEIFTKFFKNNYFYTIYYKT